MWLVYAMAAAIIWGLDYALYERIFSNKISPITMLVFQLLFGFLLFFLISFRTQLKTDLMILANNRQVLWLFVLALITFNLGNLLVFLSIEAKNATLAGLIELCYPIFTIFFTWCLFGTNRATPSVIIGGSLIFIGVFIIGYFNRVSQI